jgi:hypothetical protein
LIFNKTFKTIAIILALLFSILTGLYLSGYGGDLAMQAFLAYNKPEGKFDPAVTADSPDYSDASNWAALPGKQDLADLVPEGVESWAQGAHPIDTFFIHPTGYLKSSHWTSPMDPGSATEENTQWMMANQASAFNGCCDVYAPRYREATIFSYFVDSAERDAVLGFAYEDVKRAFDYYLENYNQGRPFIIASHSQGTHHSLRLLKEVIDNSELHRQMVAAYMVGGIVIPVSPSWFESMENIKPCQRADDLHCVVHWDTMPEGNKPMERSEASLCTNPLSWRVDEVKASADLNEGAVRPEGTFNKALGKGEDVATGQNFERLAAPQKGMTWAQCQGGTLYAENLQIEGFTPDDLGTYHESDYSLFYMNIRNNAMLRASRYTDQQSIID